MTNHGKVEKVVKFKYPSKIVQTKNSLDIEANLERGARAGKRWNEQ